MIQVFACKANKNELEHSCDKKARLNETRVPFCAKRLRVSNYACLTLIKFRLLLLTFFIFI